MPEGRMANGKEYLLDEDFSRLLGAQKRLDAAEEFMRFVEARISEAYEMGDQDTVMADGRVLRAGRDDADIAAAAVGSAG